MPARSSIRHGRPLPAGATGAFELGDFDAIQELAPDWAMRHTQIGRGKARARILLANTGRMLAIVASRSPGFLEVGTPPPGMCLLGLPIRATAIQGQGYAWENDAVAFVPDGAEYELLSSGPSVVVSLCVERSRLDEQSLERWGQPFASSPASPYLVFRGEKSRRNFVAIFSRWMAAARRRPEFLVDPATADRMESEVLDAILGGVEQEFRVPPVRPYRTLARRAESVIRQSLEETITIRDICRATGASARSVHASFRSIYGMSPMAYRKALRLSRARQDLLVANRGTTVSQVAAKWGFFRFGYFSIDYRGSFGENPSATLHRTLGGGEGIASSARGRRR